MSHNKPYADNRSETVSNLAYRAVHYWQFTQQRCSDIVYLQEENMCHVPAGWRALFATGFSQLAASPKGARKHQAVIEEQLLGVCRAYLKSAIHNNRHPLEVLSQLDVPNCLAAFLQLRCAPADGGTAGLLGSEDEAVSLG
jgi:hypothetical protein